jgi:hypothetical protein
VPIVVVLILKAAAAGAAAVLSWRFAWLDRNRATASHMSGSFSLEEK